MSDKNIIPLACRAPSVFYTVSIEHGSDGVRSIKIHDVEESDENQRRVAAALREAADMLDAPVAPAISESEDARDAARYRWLQRQRAHVWHEIADMPINRTNERIDAARAGEKS